MDKQTYEQLDRIEAKIDFFLEIIQGEQEEQEEENSEKNNEIPQQTSTAPQPLASPSNIEQPTSQGAGNTRL